MDSLGWEHAPLVLYFVLIAGLLLLLAPSFARRISPASALFLALAGLSLLYTWWYMLQYFQWSKAAAATRAGLPSITSQQWLRDSYLFEEAWLIVSKTTEAWWWSEQLCAWTAGPLTIFFAVEGKRRGIKHLWAFMLLGQVVAISVAQNLFFAALALVPRSKVDTSTPSEKDDTPPTSKPGVSWILLLSVLASLFTVGLSPRTTDGPYFLPNLLIMHALLILPLVPLPTYHSSLSLGRLYSYTAIIALRLRLPTYTTLLEGHEISLVGLRAWLPELFKQAYTTLFQHPAQSSIGYDVLFASLSFVVWMVYENHKMGRDKVAWVWVAGLVSMTPLVGVAVSSGLYLGARELELEKVEGRRLVAEKKEL
ncbi:hypothetical protein BCR35DRAFT_301906 [Leucosporidium creatinivorum]|uniref:Uncharacterized protein n=1 Tax=Leucosporidium creatinivorum TaxID=106004 RepID=A0A1Y2FXW8_9BASI|nr:hypothetical protein BCR35DRAFT_301906 [Leucosporidium creatinivorum]